ncbi:MAG: ComEC/Rec2 family competence protein, partial [Prevotella sp.]
MITSEPSRHGKVMTCDMVFVKGPLCGRKVRTSIFGNSSCQTGDVVLMRSCLESPQHFASNGKYKTDYTTYMKSRGYVARTFVLPHDMQLCTETEISLPFHLQIYRRALLFHTGLLRVFREYQSDLITQSYLSAVLLGSRTCLSSRLRDDYSKSGVSHVLALSGMHLGIIYGIFSLFLFRRRNVVCQLLLLSIIWFYVLMVGFPVSAMRAAMMLSVCTLVHLVGRRGFTLNTLS